MDRIKSNKKAPLSDARKQRGCIRIDSKPPQTSLTSMPPRGHVTNYNKREKKGTRQ
jgi:hypothetical protein